MGASLFVILQRLLPRYLMTRLVWHVARIRTGFIKDALIRVFVRMFDVDLDEIDREVPGDFRDFNEFFTRPLADGARPVDPEPAAIVSPADGTVSQAGRLTGHEIIQAKGIDYTLEELFAIDIDNAAAFSGGLFATIYLAPHNYHRVHMPLDGELLAAHYVPGDLYSVNDATAARIPGLFTRNERLNLHFSTAVGPVAVILVGALNVGSITTPWTGEIRPRRHGVVETLNLDSAPRNVAKGDLLGWFNLGSTVILLLPAAAGEWHEKMESARPLRMGEAIGTLASDPA